MPTRPNEVETRVEHGVLVVRFHKAELKSADAERLIEVVFDEAPGDADRVVLNFSEVEYINSTVMSALSRVSVARELRIVGMQATVEKILDTMGLLQFLDRSPDEATAVRELAGGDRR